MIHTYIHRDWDIRVHVCVCVWRGCPKGQAVPNFTKDYHWVVELRMIFIFSFTFYVLFYFLLWAYMVYPTRKNKVIDILEYRKRTVGIFEMFKANTFSIYTYVKSLCGTPTTNTMLHVNYVSMKERGCPQAWYSILNVVKLQCSACPVSSPLCAGSSKT